MEPRTAAPATDKVGCRAAVPLTALALSTRRRVF